MTAPTDRIVVIGAGSSALVAELATEGHGRLTAVDISPSALGALTRRLGPLAGGVEMVVADVRTLQLDHQVELWFDRATFHFLTEPADQAAYAERAATTVVAGGTLVIAGFAPDGPEMCSGLPVVRHDAASLTAVFDACFELVDITAHEHVTPWGSVQSFSYAILTRRAG